MVLHYDFDGYDYEKDLSSKELLDIVVDFYAEDHKVNNEEKKIIKTFIYEHDLEDVMFNYYEEGLHDYFYDEMYQKYKDDCADNDYWEHTNIHGGV